MNFKWLRGASLLTPVLLVVFSVTLFFLLRRPSPDEPISADVVPFVALTGIALFLSIVTMCFFIVFDIIQIAKRRSLSGAAKAGWIVALLVCGLLAVPVYGLLNFKESR